MRIRLSLTDGTECVYWRSRHPSPSLPPLLIIIFGCIHSTHGSTRVWAAAAAALAHGCRSAAASAAAVGPVLTVEAIGLFAKSETKLINLPLSFPPSHSPHYFPLPPPRPRPPPLISSSPPYQLYFSSSQRYSFLTSVKFLNWFQNCTLHQQLTLNKSAAAILILRSRPCCPQNSKTSPITPVLKALHELKSIHFVEPIPLPPLHCSAPPTDRYLIIKTWQSLHSHSLHVTTCNCTASLE